ncbi:MAG: FAD-binding protein [Clostridiales bacterium]|nr:FAD-binding protein [Clostridiales bacterium]HBM80098.1 oxidoreductase [Clostridiaceae bacterium]
MEKAKVNIKGIDIDVYSLNTVIVGSGCAGFNAADTLYSMGQRDIAILTEGINMGTSRNTGSDKQTYYKLSLSGDTPDSIMDMAKTLFEGGSMNGDIALVEAASSVRAFFKLVEAGVPFPHNSYGEYVGYKTDHDPKQRATSAGPLTSKYMTEKLEKQVLKKNIKIFDGFLVVGILTLKGSAIGLVALDCSRLREHCMGFTLFDCTNIIYATGGPAGMYSSSVYPKSQTGSMGAAFEAGARGVNLTESQYGIASTKFRWNLSGTYQQVIPRYVSTDKKGKDEREFLNEYFKEQGKMLDAIFLKGYQWPFDPRKIPNSGSSLIDILVYYETQIRGRKVYLDYTRNPLCAGRNGELDFSILSREAYDYLKKSGVLFGKPIDRLKKMNYPAYELYKKNGIDLDKEYLEISVCAQHNNGGLCGNIWYESNISHLFPVGEANGVFGVYRPGGTALNSTQVGSLRAAQYIYANYKNNPLPLSDFLSAANENVCNKIELAKKFIDNPSGTSNIMEFRKKMQDRMSKYGSNIRSLENVVCALDESIDDYSNFSSSAKAASCVELPDAFRDRDILITQIAYLFAIKEYIEKGGKSRGSYLIYDDKGSIPCKALPESFRYGLDNGNMARYICEIGLKVSENKIDCLSRWKPVRPIPSYDNWFENIWNDYRNNKIIVPL